MALSQHPSSEELIEFLEERCSARAAARVRSHLDGRCSACERELVLWRRMLGALEAGRGPEVPAGARSRAMEVFDRHFGARAPEAVGGASRGWLDRLAALVFDSRATPSLSPARGTPAEPGAFSLGFDAEGLWITLWCERRAEAWAVSGQLLQDGEQSPAPAASEWSLIVDAGSAPDLGGVTWTAPDEFEVSGLAAGRYSLIFERERSRVRLPELSLP
jgi:hypothetical protein